MNRRQVNLKVETLALDGDGDDVDLIRAIERSFGVAFGNETSKWFTAGDIYESLLGKVPSGETAGLCATSMAFYRVRAVLDRLTGNAYRLKPSTRLAGLTPYPPKRLFSMLSRDLGVRPPQPQMSWRGGLGYAAQILGFGFAVAAAFNPGMWPLVFLIPAGLIFNVLDEGVYGDMTLGDLARRLAVGNFARFAELGADTRQSALWSALSGLLAQQTLTDRTGITPETRLMA